MGILVGCGIGALSCKNGQEIVVDKIPYILGLGIKMGAVMELIPRITSLFIEGLKPISDATRELIAKKFKGAVRLEYRYESCLGDRTSGHVGCIITINPCYYLIGSGASRQ